MRVLIVSDTHGRLSHLEKVLRREHHLDLMIHLGDFEEDEARIREMAPCPLEMVSGNNDFYSDLPREKIIRIGRHQVLLTHGHHYFVSFGTSKIKDIAAQQSCDLVMFGHTHVPLIDTKGSVWAVNPGSISFPRQMGRKPSYIIMETGRPYGAAFELKYV